MHFSPTSKLGYLSFSNDLDESTKSALLLVTFRSQLFKKIIIMDMVAGK